MKLFEELVWRGFVNQTTHPEIGEIIDKSPLTLYCGFDPTADSFHVGQLVPLMALRHFQRAGHACIALIGGATGMIGDPSGKKEERQLLSKDQIERNLEGQRRQIERFLNFPEGIGPKLVNNADWLCHYKLIDFLRDIGKHFSVNALIARESVRRRLEDREHGISYTEFSYNLLQAYDFLYLYENYGCTLQVGGSDQWGNIVAGIDLIRRIHDADAYGLTFPLLTKSDGSKFGKSESGNIWLDARYTSPYKFYQFFINQADADMPRLLRLLTELPKEEISVLEESVRETPEQRAAQRRLAFELTSLVHGKTEALEAERASQAMFGGDLAGLSEKVLEEVFSEVPSASFPKAYLDGQRLLADLLVEARVFSSKGEFRRMVQSGGLYINNVRLQNTDIRVTPEWLCHEKLMVIRVGKKQYYLLRFE
ncbi:MAG TPA: tyrosine--tRNA ligase [Candidatus Hydrogenedentes bacterium]|nr:tyrosine--tRNA ligase [Candidatus Hydrogenedentota bacterium]HOL75414.1 tyrosine--tRNA ligase [Candidatus Hydrogenedentota bacterium]HPO84923.1 tyrosine--tRNA ligase [Candidatus Hydrogenedentota bacterium]